MELKEAYYHLAGHPRISLTSDSGVHFLKSIELSIHLSKFPHFRAAKWLSFQCCQVVFHASGCHSLPSLRSAIPFLNFGSPRMHCTIHPRVSWGQGRPSHDPDVASRSAEDCPAALKTKQFGGMNVRKRTAYLVIATESNMMRAIPETSWEETYRTRCFSLEHLGHDVRRKGLNPET